MVMIGRKCSTRICSRANTRCSTIWSLAVSFPILHRNHASSSTFTVGHPLIHLGYAFELDSRELGMEALVLAATQYNFLHKYLDDPAYSKPPTSPSSPTKSSTSTLEILHNIRADTRFNDLSGSEGMEDLFKTHEAAILEHWNAWSLSNPTQQFKESQSTAVALLVGSHNEDDSKDYDFFLVHLLTTSHAVRILLPLIPASHHIALARQWWLIVIAIYISQGRPAIDTARFHDEEVKGWEWVEKEALKGKWALDAHFVKALRAMKVAAATWGDDDQSYLKAAVRMCWEFDGWGGFGAMREEGMGERRGSGGV